MIIGWEWVEIGLCILLIIGLILNYICMNTNWPEAVAWVLVGIEVILITVVLCVGIPMSNAQNKIEAKYIDYLELRAEYVEADSLDRLELTNAVLAYNAWVEDTEDERNNPWHFMGTSTFATKFEKIEVK